MLGNFVAAQLTGNSDRSDSSTFNVQIAAPFSFLNSTVKMNQVMMAQRDKISHNPLHKKSHGSEQLMKYSLKSYGVFFRSQISEILRTLIEHQPSFGERGIQVSLKPQTELFKGTNKIRVEL